MARFVLLADKKFIVDTFDSQTTNPAAIMRLLYYPPQTGTVDNRVLGIGAHTEYVISSVRVVSMLITSMPQLRSKCTQYANEDELTDL